MAITDKEKGVWGLDQVYNKQNQGSIWEYTTTATQLWTWGSNNEGRLGQNNQTNYSSPIQIPGTTWSALSQSVGAMVGNNSENGQQTMFGLKTDATAWGWGRNESGEIPVNTSDSYSSPRQIPGSWSTISNAYMGGYGIKTDGTLWGWGRADYGQLGQGSPAPSQPYRSSPVQLGSAADWKDVTTDGRQSMLAIKTDGTLYGVGRNLRGVLMQNNTTQRTSLGISNYGASWDRFVPQGGHNMNFAGFKTDGTLWAGGENNGNFGLNNTTQYSSPVQIPGTWSNAVLSGGFIGTKTDGTLWTMGNNTWGILGQNNTTSYSSPIQIPGTWSSTVFGNGRFAGAAKADGTLWIWGRGNSGIFAQNGGAPFGLPGSFSSPVQIPGTDWNGKDVSWSYTTLAFLKEF